MHRSADAASIFAVASGSGRSAIAVVRLTGPATRDAVQALLGSLPEPRRASLAALRDPGCGELLDRGLVLWFPGPTSFTGEDAAEFQVHCGRAVVRGLLECLGRIPGLRPAEPGEFARRAFRNRKLDASSVEALADLIDADTQVQRRLALRQLDGALDHWAQHTRSLLVDALALAEGAIDFAEDDDVRGPFEREVRQAVATARQRIRDELSAADRGARAREGLVVAITGAPNVGKSTLLNALVGREVAIVSVHAGTTRDPIEVDLELGGHAVRLVDTAGLRDTTDPVEQEGIARARARAAAADLVLRLQDRPGNGGDIEAARPNVWRVATKLDCFARPIQADFAVSAKTGEGLDLLLDALGRRASDLSSGSETAAVSQIRHRASLLDAVAILDRALAVDPAHLELVAEELRMALGALERLTGRVDSEDVLGTIFARFCIGK